MTTRIGEVFVDIGARLKPLKDGFKQAKLDSTIAAGKIKKQFEIIDKQAKVWGKSVETITSKQKLLKNQINKLISQGINPASKQIKDLKFEYDKLGFSIKGVSQKIKKYGALILVGLGALAVAGIKKSIDAASDLEEVTSKFNVVFTDSMDIANNAVQDLQNNYAMSELSARKNLSAVQDLLVPMGLMSGEAAKMSANVVRLSADLGSFNNLPTEQVMADIQSALVGNFETMKKYGVVLNETRVKQEAMNMGLFKGNGVIDAATKATVAYNLILKDSAAAVGDMARTSNSYANSIKQINANIENMSASMGKKLLPNATKMAQVFKVITEEGGLMGATLDAIGEVGNIVLGKLVDGFLTVAIAAQKAYTVFLQMKGAEDNLYDAEKALVDVRNGNRHVSKDLLEVLQKSAKAHQNLRKLMNLQANIEYERTAEGRRHFAELQKLAQEELKINQQRSRSSLTSLNNTKSNNKEIKKETFNLTQFSIETAKKLGKEMEKSSKELRQNIINGTLSALSSLANFGNQLSSLIGQQAQNRISILQNEVEQRAAILEEERLAALEQAGVEEETDAEKQESDLLELQNNLDRAVSEREKTRIKEQIKLKQDAIKRTKINTDFAKKQEQLDKDADAKRKAIEREAAKRQKQLAIFTTLVEIPTAAFQAFRSAQVLPFPASTVVGGILAAAATALGFAKLAIIQQTPLPMAEGGVVKPPGITAEIGEGKNSELVAPLNQKIFDMMGQGIINAIAARQEISPPEEPTIEEIDQQTPGIIGGDVYLDGDKVGTWITRGTEDATIRISSRAIVT